MVGVSKGLPEGVWVYNDTGSVLVAQTAPCKEASRTQCSYDYSLKLAWVLK